MLLGLTGKAGVGKSSTAEVLARHHGFYDIAFADPLKQAAAGIFGLPLKNFYEPELKEVIDAYWGMSPRTMLQKLGTEACRNIIDQNIWIKSLTRRLENVSDRLVNVVVTDVRFDNEADEIRKLGGTVVHVISSRDSNLPSDNQKHLSESGVFFKEGDVILNNKGSFEELPGVVNVLVAELGAKHAG